MPLHSIYFRFKVLSAGIKLVNPKLDAQALGSRKWGEKKSVFQLLWWEVGPEISSSNREFLLHWKYWKIEPQE